MANISIKNNRLGMPSPLPYHLYCATFAMQQKIIASSNPVGQFKKSLQEMSDLLIGLEKWQNHTSYRDLQAPPNIWQRGSSKLFDYGQTPEAINPDGPPVLVIPSLVNKPYILDLTAETSLLRTLASKGLRPFLLDWGHPQKAEFEFGIERYITNRALPALGYIQSISNCSIGVLGYCMGGSIAAAVCQLSNKINSLGTIGAPWDFSTAVKTQHEFLQMAKLDEGKNITALLENTAKTFGTIPFEFMQYIFATINPEKFASKFQHFAKMDQHSTTAHHFVIIEDWLADATTLTGPVAVDLFAKWHVQNQITTGKWTIQDTKIDASKIDVPGIYVCAQKDTIAPLNSTLALPQRVKDAVILQPDTGHVGMIVGSKAQKTVVSPLAEFFLKHAS